MKPIISLLSLIVFAACSETSVVQPPVEKPVVEQPTVTPAPESAPTPAREEKVIGPVTALSWETKGHEYRKAWSEAVFGLINGELFATFDKAADAKRFCPKYESLTQEQKATMWSEMVSAVAFYESGWSPVSRMKEALGTDPITKKQVQSEGLLQLSYQDTQIYPFCKFDWSIDKKLDPADPKKTILKPLTNLDCGIRIMAKQIKNRGKMILTSNVYWSTLKEGGKYSKVDQIIGMTKKLQFCK